MSITVSFNHGSSCSSFSFFSQAVFFQVMVWYILWCRCIWENQIFPWSWWFYCTNFKFYVNYIDFKKRVGFVDIERAPPHPIVTSLYERQMRILCVIADGIGDIERENNVSCFIIVEVLVISYETIG